MDKQEAITFITQELEKGCPQEEIATSLSQKLGAPPAIVQTFGSQVASTWKPTPVKLPVWLSDFSYEEAQAQPAPQPLPANQAIPDEPIPPPSPMVVAPAQEIPSGKVSDEPLVPTTSRVPIKVSPEVEKRILADLKKNRAQNDIIMELCEQNGLDWGDAQRLVARVATSNRKELGTRTNILLLIMSVAALLAGIALVYASSSELIGFAQALINPVTDPELIPTQSAGSYYVRDALYAFIPGLLLAIGGAVGLFKALQSQFEIST